jgi:GNAT superfamily N-acetyltransferase
MIIVPLHGHDRSQFSCGNADLDSYLKAKASQHQRLSANQTYVGIVDEKLVGFLTVTVREFNRNDAAGELAKHPPFPLPVLLLARLGIDQTAQRKGLGGRFVVHVCRLARSLRAAVGCVGVLVDSKASSVGFYERLGFVPVAGGAIGLNRMFLPITNIPDDTPRGLS